MPTSNYFYVLFIRFNVICLLQTSCFILSNSSSSWVTDYDSSSCARSLCFLNAFSNWVYQAKPGFPPLGCPCRPTSTLISIYIHHSIYLFSSLSICISSFNFIYLSSFNFIYLSIRLFIYQYIYLSIHASTQIFI